MSKKNKKDNTEKPVGSSESIPDGVVDVKAYKLYLESTKNLSELGDLSMDVSDKFLDKIKVSQPWGRLSKVISHLPKKEFLQIEAAAKNYRSLKSSQNAQKNKAFGVKSGGVFSMQETLLDKRKTEITRMFGKFFTVDDVWKTVNQKWGYNVSKALVEKFLKDNIDNITEQQDEHKNNMDDVRLFHKKSRLEELLGLYNKASAKYDATSNREDGKFAAQLLAQVQKEVEGNKLIIDGKMQIDIQATVSMQIQFEIQKKTNLLDIIVARASAVLGVNPRFLLMRMHTSRYAKLTGMALLTDEDKSLSNPNDMIDYPSSSNYSLDELKTMFYRNKQRQSEEIGFEEVPDQSSKVMLIDEKLKEMKKGL
tara:strand:- start:1460 stop:2557 length:1098 start_codon:yes stop_codon:yes gene_type:complete